MVTYTDNTIMPFGSKKGKILGEISDGYFLKLYDAGKVSGPLKAYIEERIPVLRFKRDSDNSIKKKI